jgi:hypothetical protein
MFMGEWDRRLESTIEESWHFDDSGRGELEPLFIIDYRLPEQDDLNVGFPVCLMNGHQRK